MRRALSIGGLCLVVLGVFASAATAGTISPASADFGRVVIGKTTAPRTFTFIKGNEPTFELEPNGPSFVTNDVGGGFSQTHDTQASPNCPATLTAAHPSCTIGVFFRPDSPGRLKGEIVANNFSPDPVAPLTGIGLISRKSSFCRKQGGHFVSHKKITRWCQK